MSLEFPEDDSNEDLKALPHCYVLHKGKQVMMQPRGYLPPGLFIALSFALLEDAMAVVTNCLSWQMEDISGKWGEDAFRDP